MKHSNAGSPPVRNLLVGLRKIFATQKRHISSLEKSLQFQKNLCGTMSRQLADKDSIIKLLQLRLAQVGRVAGVTIVDEIVSVVAEICHVEKFVFYNNKKGSKQRSQTWPRQLAMCLCLEYKVGTLSFVAAAFKRKDHGTALFAKRAVHADVIQSKDKKLQYDLCKQRLNEILHARETAAGGGTLEP